jgi:very-short-patch-repair endonuclease
MIIRPQKVEVKRLNNTNIEWLKSKGYELNLNQKVLLVDIDDLPPQSNIKVWFKCDYCGERNLREYRRCTRNQHQFCDNECSKKYKEIKKKENNISCSCEYCTRNYDVTQSQYERYGSRFCSKECRNKWESENKKGENHHNFLRVKILCDYCKEPHYVKRYKLESKQQHFFCSENCRKEWYSKVWSQSPEWKETSKKRAVEILTKGLVNKVNTEPHRKVNNLLNLLGISFESESPFDYYTVDCYLNDNNLAIEVMGSYWHCDPRVFNNIKYKMQLHRIYKDKAKRTYLKEKYGIKILYLWEEDIKNNPELCLKLILKYVNSQGDLQDYNSFNYELEGEKIKLKQKLIKPYIDYTTKSLSTKCKFVD